MNATCPRCNSLIEPNSSFCTNCGAVLAAQNPYQQPGTPSAPQDPYQQPYGQTAFPARSEEHTSELQSHLNLVCRLLLEKKKKNSRQHHVKYTRATHMTS